MGLSDRVTEILEKVLGGNEGIESNIRSISKGEPVTVLLEASETTLSTSVSCIGYTSVLVYIVINGGTWNIKLSGNAVDEGVFISLYDGSYRLATGEITQPRCVLFRGVPDYVKALATLVSGAGTCSIIVQPLN